MLFKVDIIREEEYAEVGGGDLPPEEGGWYSVILDAESAEEARSRALAAECADHENDHMDGILFKSKVERMLAPDELSAD